MNKFTLLAACLLFSSFSFAKIWRVNNNPGIAADFTTLQAAHNGAASGDTIYLEASPLSYGGLSTSKKIHVLGAGYFLDQNINLQAAIQSSIVGHIYFNSGSAGSVIEGVFTNSSGMDVNVPNVIIRRNLFMNFSGVTESGTGTITINAGGNNILIIQNYGCMISNYSTVTGVLIINNYIATHAYSGAEYNGYQAINLASSTVAIIKNNIIRRGTVTVYSSNISNNIMYNGVYNGTGNLTSNNIANASQFGTTNGNQENVSMASVFELTGSTDARWKLKAGSPAIAAGYGSTPQNPIDCGMFGGSTPYVLSGIPPVPSIYYFANQPVGSNSDPIDVQIKVRSNN